MMIFDSTTIVEIPTQLILNKRFKQKCKLSKP